MGLAGLMKRQYNSAQEDLSSPSGSSAE